MEKGFYDDFEFDFGWTVIANAETGNWERGIPNPTNNTVPQLDANYDCGKNAFITGNNSNLDPDFDDVDNGYTTLLSPQFNVNGFTTPYLNYDIAHYCFHGPQVGDDTLNIYLLTGTDQFLIDQIIPPSNTMSWVSRSIPITNLLPLSNSLQLQVYISDLSPNINVTEAAFDRFSITNYSTAGNELIKDSDLFYFPNPTNQSLTIQGLELGNSLAVIDLKGNLLIKFNCEKETESIDLSLLSPGFYYILYNGKSYKLIKN